MKHIWPAIEDALRADLINQPRPSVKSPKVPRNLESVVKLTKWIFEQQKPGRVFGIPREELAADKGFARQFGLSPQNIRSAIDSLVRIGWLIIVSRDGDIRLKTKNGQVAIQANGKAVVKRAPNQYQIGTSFAVLLPKDSSSNQIRETLFPYRGHGWMILTKPGKQLRLDLKGSRGRGGVAAVPLDEADLLARMAALPPPTLSASAQRAWRAPHRGYSGQP
jgi:hypothetical protein